MAYWNREDTNDVQLLTYKNDYGQTIAVGDFVHYPTWCGDLNSGHVTKIVEFDAETWNYKLQKSVPVRKQNIWVKRKCEVYRWDPKTEKGERKMQMRTIKIYYAHRVIKLYPDEVF
jgi:hypothetical protein